MQIIQGKTVYKGVAMGPVLLLNKQDSKVKRVKIEDAEAEVQRIAEAVEEAKAQLQTLYEKAVQEVGEAGADIFAVHQMMLEDAAFLDAAYNMVRTESINGEYAVATAGEHFSNMFAEMEDTYMQARAADVRDIAERVIRILKGDHQEDGRCTQPSVVVAEDLTPSETVQMDKNHILAFVTVHGSLQSHTAILARMMNIPALVGVPLELSALKNGDMVIVDGEAGQMILSPDAMQQQSARERIAEAEHRKELLQSLRGKENVTQDGRQIELYANIGSVGDIGAVLEQDAGGIGLFRSEFLYLSGTTFPSEEEQYRVYKQALQMMAGKKVIIRTLDIGADKQVAYFGLAQEENPAMGYRAIRICLKQPDIFKVQLRALFRASISGNLSVMYPMITSVEEVRAISAIVQEVCVELDAEGIPYQVPEQGIMIETPAAVMISDLLAKEVDFFSIGTNDLTQYTLAIDRQNEKLDDFYNPRHPAILRMIQLVVENAHKHGKWVGICGELGADLTLTEEFLRMGVDELSVAPSMVLPLRQVVRSLEL